MTKIIVSDFDGTITKVDCLYNFFKKYAKENWLEVEQLWTEGKIGSKECLIREFALVENLTPELIEKHLETVELDSDFKEFNELRLKKDVKLVIVSDGVDYFIKKILQKNGIKNIEIISNHGEFINKEFKMSYPNQNPDCKNNSGTCKCKIVNNLKQKYDEIIYIGDGVSDFCVANKADKLFAKASLLKYCQKNNIKHIEFKTFKDVATFCL